MRRERLGDLRANGGDGISLRMPIGTYLRVVADNWNRNDRNAMDDGWNGFLDYYRRPFNEVGMAVIRSSLHKHTTSPPNEEDRIRLYDEARTHGALVLIEDWLDWDEKAFVQTLFDKQKARMTREVNMSMAIVRMR